MKIRDVIKILVKDGWFLARTKGSHRQFKHPVKRGAVTVSGKLSNDIAASNLSSIISQSGISKEAFR